jgi:tyrosine-protein phosphatase non-receptor type 23
MNYLVFMPVYFLFLQHLKDTFPHCAGVDLAPDVMQFMYHLSLAQAQECILEKSMMDNRKATIIGECHF